MYSKRVQEGEKIMADKSVNINLSGVVTGLLGVLFVGLKLTGYIAWSWWWVTLPFWGGFVIAVMIFAVVLILAAVFN